MLALEALMKAREVVHTDNYAFSNRVEAESCRCFLIGKRSLTTKRAKQCAINEKDVFYKKFELLFSRIKFLSSLCGFVSLKILRGESISTTVKSNGFCNTVNAVR